MPWLKHKRAIYATPLSPLVSRCSSGRTYLCTGADGGRVEVPFRDDVAELLNPSGDLASDWEVEWERHGVTFDAQGKEMPCEGAPGETGSEAIPPPIPCIPPQKARGRPKKR